MRCAAWVAGLLMCAVTTVAWGQEKDDEKAAPTTLPATPTFPIPPVPAFPGAEGFGAIATGGRGGQVVKVTNLDDSGPGSFREAVSQPGRTVIFDVGGIVRLKSPVDVAKDITIAGQTAPAPGITLFGHGVSVSKDDNVIIRHVRMRASMESSRGSKTLNSSGGTRMIFDHCSISWGRWDNLGFTQQSFYLTLSNCIIAEAIDPQRFGALIDSSRNITVVRNLWINNQSRNPKGKADMQYINNVVYNWGSGGYCGGHSGAVWKQDLIGNAFIAGPSSKKDGALIQFARTDEVYQTGNKLDLEPDGKLELREVAAQDFRPMKDPADNVTLKPDVQNKPHFPVRVTSAEEALREVTEKAGASLHRDDHDLRQINNLRSNGTAGAIIRGEMEVGGIGNSTEMTRTDRVDTDNDGLPDAWETSNGLDPTNGTDSAKIDPRTPGYTYIEVYINSLAQPVNPNSVGSR